MKNFWIFILGVITAIVGFFILTDKTPTADTPPINNEQQQPSDNTGDDNNNANPDDPSHVGGTTTYAYVAINGDSSLFTLNFSEINGNYVDQTNLIVGTEYILNGSAFGNYVFADVQINSMSYTLPARFVATEMLDINVTTRNVLAVDVTINSPYAIVEIHDMNGELVQCGDAKHKDFISGETYIMNNIAINEGYYYADGWLFEGLFIDGVAYPNWQGATFSVVEGTVIEVRIVQVGQPANISVSYDSNLLSYRIYEVATGREVTEFSVGTQYKLRWFMNIMDSVNQVVVNGMPEYAGSTESITFTATSNTSIQIIV